MQLTLHERWAIDSADAEGNASDEDLSEHLKAFGATDERIREILASFNGADIEND